MSQQTTFAAALDGAEQLDADAQAAIERISLRNGSVLPRRKPISRSAAITAVWRACSPN